MTYKYQIVYYPHKSAGLKFAKEKGRTIVVKAHTYQWYNDSPREIGVAHPNGSIERYY